MQGLFIFSHLKAIVVKGEQKGSFLKCCEIATRYPIKITFIKRTLVTLFKDISILCEQTLHVVRDNFLSLP